MSFSTIHHHHHLSLILLFTLLHLSHGADTFFTIPNNCSYTVWPAVIPGGGVQLNAGQAWIISIASGTTGGRIWARTGCSFDTNGKGNCTTGDCGGVLKCTGNGTPPATLAEFSTTDNAYYDMSLIEGFNVPMAFSPTNSNFKDLSCDVDINGQCPKALRTSGGCSNPCTTSNNCTKSVYSRFFRKLCPDAYIIPNDPGTNVCPIGTNYRVTFYPGADVVKVSTPGIKLEVSVKLVTVRL